MDTLPTTGWYRLEVAAAAAILECDLDRGLDHRFAVARGARFGRNAIAERGGKSPWKLLAAQVSSTLVLVLVIAAGVSFAPAPARRRTRCTRRLKKVPTGAEVPMAGT